MINFNHFFIQPAPGLRRIIVNYLLFQQACNPACQLRCLEIHNYYRSLHNSPPLFCDPTLAKSAQQWADQQARDGNMYHSEWTDKFTESISWRGEGWLGRYITYIIIIIYNCLPYSVLRQSNLSINQFKCNLFKHYQKMYSGE